jgi:selenophosphate synthase
MYGEKVRGKEGATLITMCDPQTNGGLLFSIDPMKKNEIIALFEMEKIPLFEIGKFTEAKDMAISIE